MEKFYREATKSSPEVSFDPGENKLIIRGESYPENSFAFYNPLFEILEQAIKKLDKLELEIQVSYLNTSSTKSFMNLLDIIEQGYENNMDVTVNWYYKEDNEHSYELALDFNEYLKLPFNIIPLN